MNVEVNTKVTVIATIPNGARGHIAEIVDDDEGKYYVVVLDHDHPTLEAWKKGDQLYLHRYEFEVDNS